MPPDIPSGWEEYADWTCDCRFYVPASPAALPAPIVWEPCPESPGGIVCRQMHVDWPYINNRPISPDNYFEWTPGSTPLLAFRRTAGGAPQPYTIDMVAEVDGVARNALIWRMPPGAVGSDVGCAPGIDSMAEGKWVLSIRGDHATHPALQSKHKGMIGGPIDQLHPPVLAHFVDDESHGYVASADWIATWTMPDDRYDAAPWPWTGQTITPVASGAADPEGFIVAMFRFKGGAAFWEAASQYGGGINVWTPAAGARPFIRWVGDYTRLAGSFGTDGVDMVWAQGQKHSVTAPEFAGSIWTASFVTEPAAVQPRRLRSYTDQIGTHEWAVGCGYAANIWDTSTIVVRLSDGVSWMLQTTATMEFTNPIGVTCDEVFIQGWYGGTRNIARIRLDSLGPGTPPD